MFPQNILDSEDFLTTWTRMPCTQLLEYCSNVKMVIFISPQMTNMLKAAQLQRAQMEAHKDALLKVIVGIE